MNKNSFCYACDKRIIKKEDLAVGSLGYESLFFRIFHKTCFEKYKVQGKYFDPIERKISIVIHPRYGFFNDMYLALTSLFYSMGLYTLNSWRFWIIVFPSIFCLFLIIPAFEFLHPYYLIARGIIIFLILYLFLSLIYFYKKYVW